MAQIGFIGLGHMGLPMATQLIRAGHHVIGFDLHKPAMEALESANGHRATSLHDIGTTTDVIFTMLQTGKQVEATYIGKHGLFTIASPNTLYIDCSSIDITTTKYLHQTAEETKRYFIDAPVSGGVAGAALGTLTFMVGGHKATFEQAKPILQHMGKKIIYTGPGGSGQAAKICNNTILGISMVAVAEAFTLAKQLGLNPSKLHDVISNSSGQCWVTDRYLPVAGVLDDVPANHDYQPGFSTAMMLKDLLLSQNAAEKAGLVLPLAKKTTALYQSFFDSGMGDKDFSAIIQMLKID